MNKCELGADGETQAITYLKKRGYVIIERNYRFGYGHGKNEIDIICEKGGVVVFVEVKKRLSNSFGTPLEAIDSNKIKSIAKVAEQYLSMRGLLDKCQARFDVIGIQEGRLEHIENAF